MRGQAVAKPQGLKLTNWFTVEPFPGRGEPLKTLESQIFNSYSRDSARATVTWEERDSGASYSLSPDSQWVSLYIIFLSVNK